jgi:hypothetical protein
LPVKKDALGKTFTFSLESTPVEVTIPQGPDDFLFWRPFVPGEYRAVLDVPLLDETFVQVIRVAVLVGADTSAAAASAGDQEALARAVEAIDKAQEMAVRAITGFVAWVRATTRITGIGVSGEAPPLAGPVRAFESGTGRLFNTGPTIRSIAVGRDPEGQYSLTAADLNKIAERVGQGNEAPVGETLLADAEYYVGHAVRDFRRAVLMAAIAWEVKVKDVLRHVASEEQQSLLDFALENPREVTVTAADGLFDKLMHATSGRSLRQDDRQLFKHIQELYTVRNRIAHSGRLPDELEAGRVVRSARRCFTWLDGVQQTHGAGLGLTGQAPTGDARPRTPGHRGA